MVVEAKTLGSPHKYLLQTTNMSASGLLIKWDRHQKIPFNVNTLIELSIEANVGGSPKRHECFGKVVRRLDVSGMTCYGVKLVSSEAKDHERWVDYLNDVTATA
jgi:hypothetical protein